MSEPLKIYLSYSAKDRELVTKVYHALRREGFRPWMFDEDVLPGDEWHDLFTEAIHSSDVFIFFVSNSSVEEDFFQHEIKVVEALQRQRPKGKVLLIPIRLQFASDLPNALARFQAISASYRFSLSSAEIKDLVKGLKRFEERLKDGNLSSFQQELSLPKPSRDLIISTVELVNIRCFENLRINLEEHGNPIRWAMILGDNAVGKTTLLRSIALGLCNESDATALIRASSGSFVRQGTDEGQIKITLSELKKSQTTTREPNSRLIQQLHRELLKTFPTYSKLRELRGMLSLEFNQNLDTISSSSRNLDEQVINLIRWAEDVGRLDELVEATQKMNPGSLLSSELHQQEETKTYTITTQIIRQTEDTEIVRQTIEPNTDFLWSDVFLCGYGANRTTQTYANYESYKALDAVQSLFSSQVRFQDPEVVLLRRDPEIREQLERQLLNILMLDDQEHRIRYTDRGIELEGPWGQQPLQVLSDGYRSTTQWVLDFIGWLIQADRLTDNSEISGILLLDEIEQHLHPRWQRYIVQRLRQKFPKTQIIASTHTPLVASGIADVESGILLKLDQDEEDRIGIRVIDKKSLDGKRADQVLASEAFGLPTSRNPGSQNDIDRYTELLSHSSRTESEESELQNLRSHLQDTLQSGETEAAQVVRKAVSETLQESVQNISPEHLDLEIQRYLQQLSQPEVQNEKD